MDKNSTISIQEVRRDPKAFLDKINQGKTLTVIYHSKPLATVKSADHQSTKEGKSVKRMLQYASLARNSAHKPLDPAKSYKEMYAQDMAKKYGIS